MYCKKCGTELSEQAEFCGKCGAPTKASASQNSSDFFEQASGAAKSGMDGIKKGASKINERLTTEGVDEATGKTREAWLKFVDVSQETKSDFAGNRDEVARLLGNTGSQAYYLQEFEKTKQKQPTRFNFAAFFLGIYHAAYRNMWREWLFIQKYTILAAVVSVVLSLVATVTFSGFFMGLSSLVQLVTFVVGIIASLKVGKTFNNMYMHRIDDMLQDKIARVEGVSVGRALIPVGVLLVIAILIGALTSALIPMLYF